MFDPLLLNSPNLKSFYLTFTNGFEQNKQHQINKSFAISTPLNAEFEGYPQNSVFSGKSSFFESYVRNIKFKSYIF